MCSVEKSWSTCEEAQDRLPSSKQRPRRPRVSSSVQRVRGAHDLPPRRLPRRSRLAGHERAYLSVSSMTSSRSISAPLRRIGLPTPGIGGTGKSPWPKDSASLKRHSSAQTSLRRLLSPSPSETAHLEDRPSFSQGSVLPKFMLSEAQTHIRSPDQCRCTPAVRYLLRPNDDRRDGRWSGSRRSKSPWFYSRVFEPSR